MVLSATTCWLLVALVVPHTSWQHRPKHAHVYVYVISLLSLSVSYLQLSILTVCINFRKTSVILTSQWSNNMLQSICVFYHNLHKTIVLCCNFEKKKCWKFDHDVWAFNWIFKSAGSYLHDHKWGLYFILYWSNLFRFYYIWQQCGPFIWPSLIDGFCFIVV